MEYKSPYLNHRTKPKTPNKTSHPQRAVPTLLLQVLDAILKIIEGHKYERERAEPHFGNISFRCDCFAAWGPRTVDGNVRFKPKTRFVLVRAPNTERCRASRNLDWTKDTGISAAKIVTVYHAVEVNQHTYATVGFAGFSAALAGMRHHHHHHHHLSLLLPPRYECCWPHCQRGQPGQLSRNF